jgi:hypothetical protein
MGIITKAHVPVASKTKLNVAPGAAIAAGTGAYGTATTAGSGDWVLGSAMPKGRALLAVVNTGAIANAPTAIKVSMHGGASDANGSSGTEIASTVTEWATPPGDEVYTAEIDLAAVTDLTKYYSLAVTVNGAGATSTIVADAAAILLDPTYVP